MGFSTTIYVPDGLYDYARDTRDEENDQSVNQRLAELADRGKEAEQNAQAGVQNE